MSQQPAIVHLSLRSADDAPPEEIEQLTAALRSDLLTLDVEQVTTVGGGTAPEGAKAIELTQLGELLIAASMSPVLLGQLVGLVRTWIGRRRGVEIELEVGDAKLQIRGASADDTQRLVDSWIDSALAGPHAGRAGAPEVP